MTDTALPPPSPEDRSPDDWHRLHPITPVINGLRGGGIALLIIAQQSLALGAVSGEAVLWAWLGIAVIGVPAVAGIVYLQWRAHQYWIAPDAVHLKKGIVFRQHVQARLDRLQAVDIVEPFIGRIFGFAEVKVEVAGGQGSGVKLRLLPKAQALELRNRIVGLAAGVRPQGAAAPAAAPSSASLPVASGPAPSGPATPTAAAPVAFDAAPSREVYRLPTGRLLGSIVLSWASVGFLATVVAAVIAVAVAGAFALPEISDSDLAAAGYGPLAGFVSGTVAIVGTWLLAFAGAAWKQFSSAYGFTAGVSRDGIRLEHGLLDKRRQTVPPGRVQAVRLVQPLPWRRVDWWRITTNVAGYQEQQEAVSTLLPVGPRSDALYAVWLVLPDLGDPDPAGALSAAMSGRGSEHGFTASPPRAFWVDPFQWRRRGVRATGNALLIRRGLFARALVIVPHEKTQSLALRQGPLQRVLGLASVEVHSTKGVVVPLAEHLAVEDAIALLDAQARRATEARARQTPDQWMARVAG